MPVYCQRDRAKRGCGAKHVSAELGRSVQHKLPRLPRAHGGEALNQLSKLGRRHSNHHKFTALDDLRGVEPRHARK